MTRSQKPTLVCYDGSDSAKRALEVVGSQLALDNVVLLKVWNKPLAVLHDSYVDAGAPGPTLTQLETIEINRAYDILEQGADIAHELGFSPDARVARARAEDWQAILDVAERLDAGLIVLGTHGHAAVDSDLLGSISGPVVRHSTRPVLIVPSPAQS